MGTRASARTGKIYHHRRERLDEIAVQVYNSKRGSFLKAMADTWLRADIYNKRILWPAWTSFIERYSLDEEARERDDELDDREVLEEDLKGQEAEG